MSSYRLCLEFVAIFALFLQQEHRGSTDSGAFASCGALQLAPQSFLLERLL